MTKPIEKKSVKKQLAQYKAEEKLENEMKKQVEKAKETLQPVTTLKEQVSKVPVSKIQKEKGK